MCSGSKWIWHPEWIEGKDKTSAGGFVHFRKSISVKEVPTKPHFIQITADTRYKIYINSKLVLYGPVKGDEHMWFYDEIDIQPYLKVGRNDTCVRVMRLYHATSYGTSFPRLPHAGLYIKDLNGESVLGRSIESDSSWETALDLSTRLRTDLKEDDFLHIYEDVRNDSLVELRWISAKELKFESSHGLSAPWRLSPRLIPRPREEQKRFKAIHNLKSSESHIDWQKGLLESVKSIRLPAGTSHHIELEVEHHMTAFLNFRFEAPLHAGSSMRVTYSECYEDTPEFVPYIRRKDHRLDTTKQLIGPEDKFVLGSRNAAMELKYHDNASQEIFSPFHFRTFRFLTLDIEVGEECDLIMKGIDIIMTNYPLDVVAEFKTSFPRNGNLGTSDLWETSIRTLQNCMHDCYEDCPFYEQLQYAMDIRSSALFTYCVSGDDRMARQAIIQLHNSYRPSLGLTASRAPAHQYQIIPHFSLYWICMVTDHFEYFGDADFARRFTATFDGVFESFSRRLDPELGLVRIHDQSTHWDFVDWTEPWKPMGIPPAADRTGYSTYTSMLYAYTLRKAAGLLIAINRPGLAEEYEVRAAALAKAVTTHCFDGSFFTDGLASKADESRDLSQHSQIWAVLCGAIEGDRARELLRRTLSSSKFSQTSTAMAFYTLRALSLVGGSLYDEHFHSFWEPWRIQLAQGLTTWTEDNVTQRSDCHAWGSVPLYEFLAEVAGIKPGAPGSSVISFKPRVSLCPEVDARIPFRKESVPGIAYVKWSRGGEITKVTLELVMDNGQAADVPVWVYMPNGELRVMSGKEVIVLEVSSNSSYES